MTDRRGLPVEVLQHDTIRKLGELVTTSLPFESFGWTARDSDKR